MTDVIQHNAANILALSMLLFTSAVALPDNKFLALITEPPKDDSRAEPSTPNNTPSQSTA
jgi:hypothetical protein